MDLNRARQVAESFFSGKTEFVQPDPRLDEAAFFRADQDKNSRLTRQELTDALVAETVAIDHDRLIPAKAIDLSPPLNPETGLGATPWMRTAFLPSQYEKLPAPVAIGRLGTLTQAQLAGLEGQDFEKVAQAAQTPEDVALLLGHNFTYDRKRADELKGFPGAYSAQEMLDKETGICRDYHALARDLLAANGYKAELLGYWSSNQAHAVTVYQDPQSGYWGVLEYGKLFPPDQLKAKSPEDALLAVRPTILTILHYENNGPDQRSSVDGIFYTPAYRTYQRFMAGPAPGMATGVTRTNQAESLTVASTDRSWQGQLQVNTDPRQPYLQGTVMAGVWKTFADAGLRVGAGVGYVPHNATLSIRTNAPTEHALGIGFVSAEEFHPHVPLWANLAGTGIHVSARSHTVAHAGLAFDEQQVDGITTAALANLTWNPELHASRRLGPVTADLGYGLGADASLIGLHYAWGGKGTPPLSQYLTAGITSQPVSWLQLSARGYLPVTNHSNDFSREPLTRLELTTPYASIATTQGRERGRYDLKLGTEVNGMNMGGFATIHQDRVTGRTEAIGGFQVALSH